MPMTERRPRLDQLSPEKRAYICAELIRHLVDAEQFDRVDALLGNLEFLAQRCRYDGVDGVVRDFELVRASHPRPWDDDAKQAQLGRFIARTSHLLRLEPLLVLQEAGNSGWPEVVRAAQALDNGNERPWLRRLTQHPDDHHRGQVVSLAFWNGELAVSTTGLEVWVWDCATGKVRLRCDAPPSPAKSLAPSPDGTALAAACGSSDPTPFAAGLHVWARDGGVRTNRSLSDWAYTVRWRTNDEIIGGGGLPLGSEAIGKIWRFNVADETCEELGNWLADRPVVLTWDPVPGDPEQLMALTMDGVVLYLAPGYTPISPEEAADLSLQLMSDGDYQAHDRRMAARRPILAEVAAPTTDKDGYLCTAATFQHAHGICVLGEPPVPPEFVAYHTPEADGIHVVDLDNMRYGHIEFYQSAREAGFRALCIAASPVDERMVIGAAHGAAYLMAPERRPQVVHQGSAAVTAVCFDPSGKLVAVGDAAGQIALHDLERGTVVFRTERPPTAIGALLDPDVTAVLFEDRLEIDGDVVSWPGKLSPVDLARCEDTVAVLCHKDAKAGRSVRLVLISLSARKVVSVLKIDPLDREQPVDETHPAHPFRRVELTREAHGIRVHLGSAEGVTERLLAQPDRYVLRALPKEVTDRERSMSVLRIGLDEPDLACGLFAAGSFGLLCAYSDNLAHPNIAGELHGWNPEHAEVAKFASAITALHSAGNVVVVGTEHGEVVALRHDNGAWHRLGTVTHPVEVAAVAAIEDLGCSVSRDGLVLVWRLDNGLRVLMTSIDADPLHVALTRTQLSVVDRAGRVHAWEIKEPAKAS